MVTRIIIGHYGCGKTNLSINLAVRWKCPVLIDLDIVNPYFRSSDYAEYLKDHGVTVHGPTLANTNLDTPALSAAIGPALLKGNAIVDVGGDDAGATALGRYRSELKDYEMYYVINRYRSQTTRPEEAAEILKEIEGMCGLKASYLINNSHLKTETTAETVLDSLDFADKVSEMTGLPIKYTTCPKHLQDELKGIDNLLPVDIIVNTPWEYR